MDNDSLKRVTIYTDGACSGNPGNGGWGAILLCDTFDKNGTKQVFKKKISGGEKDTTNNKMELTAVIEGLKTLKVKCDVEIFTDSKYVMEGATKWMTNWIKNNWRTADKKPVKNIELWQELNDLLVKHKVAWHWVKGHADDALNNEVDALARNEALSA